MWLLNKAILSEYVQKILISEGCLINKLYRSMSNKLYRTLQEKSELETEIRDGHLSVSK